MADIPHPLDPASADEYLAGREIMAADRDWRAAMARRGLTDLSKIRIAPITAGAYRAPAADDERRMVRVLGFLQAAEHDLAWAHPIDGVTVHVDLIEKKVLRVTDEFQWSLRVGFDLREGLTLHQVELAGRPVIYRASVPEMVVPYGDPRFRYWQAYFDTGEPRVVPNAICIHEEDAGILWKHTDIFNGSAQSRRQRRLVVSYFTTVGNYDYGFYWYFYLDGTIECEVKMTGVVFTAAHPGGDQYLAVPRGGKGSCRELPFSAHGRGAQAGPRARCVPDRTVNQGHSRSLTTSATRRRPANAPPRRRVGQGNRSLGGTLCDCRRDAAGRA